MDHDFNAAILEDHAHRPWPMPSGPWLMTQTWHDLLFAHWPVDVDRLRSLVPSAFDVDRFEGSAWISVVAFRMTNVSLRMLPNLPGLSEFPELNVRTYVTANERPGVFFFSLDAGSAIAARGARLALNLPYFHAAMSVDRTADAVLYRSRRIEGGAEFEATYHPVGPAIAAPVGSLDYFLTERYCLYHVDRSAIPYRLDIHHPPWPLQVAEARIDRNTMTAASGLPLPGDAPLLHYARRQDVVAWPPARLHEV